MGRAGVVSKMPFSEHVSYNLVYNHMVDNGEGGERVKGEMCRFMPMTPWFFGLGRSSAKDSE